MTLIDPYHAAQPLGPTLLAGFAASVQRHPNQIAVKASDGAMTYSELDRAANMLAADIRIRVPDRASRVAILVERSTQLVVAALAVIRTGSCYVPLDPTSPPARLELILGDSGAALVVTSQALRNKLGGNAPVLYIDEPRISFPENWVMDVEPATCAYIIFTSGTTGRPKGVRISHGNVMSLFTATDALADVSHRDVWSMFHSFAFDFSVWEMWGALLHGGRVVIVPEPLTKDPRAFWRLLHDEGVTILSQTPTAFRVLLDEDRKHLDRLPLRRVVFGGEALRLSDVEPWIAKYGDQRPELVNMYGITETTIHASYHRVTAANVGERRSLIGRPLPGSDILLVDRDLVAVPQGQVGEMIVVGPGVGLGYLDQPELTRQRFIQLPGRDGRPVRGYRSGDQARCWPDGDLEFLGRSDDQVKIRGFRVELGEIEAALARYPAVRACAVAVRKTPAGEDVLMGYIVATNNDSLDEHRLRAHLNEVLPAYMVPATFTTLSSLPMTVNGKLDRSALPEPEIAGTGQGRTPRSLREELLCQIFAQVLGCSAVGADDDFFELGAHSLSAVQVVSRVKAVLGLELTIQDVLEARTVAALLDRTGLGDRLPPLTRRQRNGPTPLSYAQHRLWHLHRARGPAPTDHLLCTLHLAGRVDVAALELAIHDVVERHEILRTVYPERNGMPVQHILAPDACHPMLVARQVPPERLDELVDSIAQNGFELVRDLPLRVALYGIGSEESALVLAIHHIAADEWSLGPLLRDLARAYTARLAGEAPAWSPLPVQYADYAMWQRALLGDQDDPDSAAGRQLAFWNRYLQDASGEPATPTRRSSTFVRRVRMDVDAHLHARFTDLARTSATTVGIVLHAAVAALLTRLGAGTDLLVGVAGTGRADESRQLLVGRIGNTLVTRTDTSGDPSFATLLRRVRAACLVTSDHQDLPVECLFPRQPIAMVEIGTEPTHTRDIDMPHLVVKAQLIKNHSPHAGMSFRFTERWGPNGEPRGVAGVFEYRSDLFEPGTAARIADRWTSMLTAVLSDVGAPLSQLDSPPAFDIARLRRLVADALDEPIDSINDDFFQLLASEGAIDAVLSLRTGPTGEPLFLIHPSSGLCWSYVGLVGHVPSGFPVYGLQAHGLLRPDEMPATVEEMATSYIARILALQPGGPYHLLGWSLGGIVAYEMAVQLQALGAQIGLLALVDSYPRPPADTDLPPVAPSTSKSVVELRVDALLRTARHNRRIATSYEPRFFDGDLLLFQAAKGRARGRFTAAVWADFISGQITVHEVQATHMSMMDPAALVEIGPILAAKLHWLGRLA